MLSAVAGVTQGGFSRFYNPILFMGQELDVLAAVIIGGASITGGRGTVVGTILGVILIDVLNRGLILVGSAAEWQKLIVGLVLAVFISIPAIRERRARRLRYVTES